MSGPFTGIILQLLSNLQNLEFRHPHVDYCDTFGPLFGEYHPNYSGQVPVYVGWRPKRTDTPNGIGLAPNLQKLKCLRINAHLHPNVFGLGFLPQIKTLDLSLRTYNGQPDSISPYTPGSGNEFRHIEILRIDTRICYMDYKLGISLEHLTHVLPSFTGAHTSTLKLLTTHMTTTSARTALTHGTNSTCTKTATKMSVHTTT